MTHGCDHIGIDVRRSPGAVLAMLFIEDRRPEGRPVLAIELTEPQRVAVQRWLDGTHGIALIGDPVAWRRPDWEP